MKKIQSMFLVLLAVVVSAGCGDKASEKKVAESKPTLTDVTSGENAKKIKEAVVQAARPKADKNTPMENYLELGSGNQLMFAYLALMNAPIDHKEIAEKYSKDYSRASDEFKKNDLLIALKPRIDEEIAKSKSARYVKISMNRAIEKFDFEKKGFPLTDMVWDPRSYQYFNDNSEYKLSFSNGESYRYLKTASEEDARKIEGMRSAGTPMNLMVYCFMQDADPSNKSIKAEIVKVSLVDKKGDVLASQ